MLRIEDPPSAWKPRDYPFSLRQALTTIAVPPRCWRISATRQSFNDEIDESARYDDFLLDSFALQPLADAIPCRLNQLLSITVCWYFRLAAKPAVHLDGHFNRVVSSEAFVVRWPRFVRQCIAVA